MAIEPLALVDVASAPELNSSPLNERVRLGGSCMTHPEPNAGFIPITILGDSHLAMCLYPPPLPPLRQRHRQPQALFQLRLEVEAPRNMTLPDAGLGELGRRRPR